MAVRRQTGTYWMACLVLAAVCMGLGGCSGAGTPAAARPAPSDDQLSDAAPSSAAADAPPGGDAADKDNAGDEAGQTADDEPTEAEATASEAADTQPESEESDANTPSETEQADDAFDPDAPRNPFVRRFDMPPLPGDLEWLNTKPISLDELRGKFVLLDFWTYCCINCMHVLPELKKLEHAYPNNVVVIGVHSAKFETEKDSENIAEAIMRYKIEHPVVNDHNHAIWDSLGVSSWPTLVLIDPEGKLVWARPGEVEFETLDQIIAAALPYYRHQKLLDERPLHFELLEYKAETTPLRYPGKVLADEAGDRLFITDSNHNRIVITSLAGELREIIGSGASGAADGGYAECSFNQPQGVALDGETLYVADTENHLIRKVDLGNRQVTTIAGVGRQGRVAWPGLASLGPADPLPERWVGKPLETALNSPWALLVQNETLYIAMAGPHQIWHMPLDESEIGPYAGNGREDIVDGPLLPREPYALGASSFAQPSGLATDGTWIYVADSEGSSIRAVPLDPSGTVKTVVGTAHLPYGRLFHFGDVDGPPGTALLQHCLGVAYHEGKLYVADAYNHKIRVVDAETGETTTLAGTGKAGAGDDPAEFHEPAGISYAAGKLYVADTNNHLIRTIDLASGKVATLEISGLEPPKRPLKKPSFADAVQVKVPELVLKPDGGQVRLEVKVALPSGWKFNEAAPQRYWLESAHDQGVVARSVLGPHPVEPPGDFTIELPVSGDGQDELTVSLNYFYCETEDGLCKVGSVVWTVPLVVRADAESSVGQLEHETPVSGVLLND